jgi:putative ATP-dependent endonuclease of OLD family
MEYHGMGTRSWASLLVLRAFAAIIQSERQDKPFHPFLALEEPEAHLHPNAQRQVYRQMVDFPGQTVISTHSPYVAAQCSPKELRSLARNGSAVEVCQLPTDLSQGNERIVRRRVIDTRGEILFARLVVLFEGETEEQALPRFFEADLNCSPHDAGVCFVGVGGACGYQPFLTVLEALRVNWIVFSDGEKDPLRNVQSALEGCNCTLEDPRVVVIPNGQCFESYLVAEGYGEALVRAIDSVDGENGFMRWVEKTNGTVGRARKTSEICPQCEQSIHKGELRDYSTDEGLKRALLERLSWGKTKYAAAIAREISNLAPERHLPPIIRTLLDRIRTKLPF